MTQLQLTRATFTRLGSDLRRRSEAFLAVCGPAIVFVVLLSAGATYVLVHMPRNMDRRTFYGAIALQVGVLMLDWVVGLFTFGALAALAERSPSIATCWKRCGAAWKTMLALVLLLGIVWFGLNMTFALLLRNPALGQQLSKPAVQIGWQILSLLLFSTLLLAIPDRIHHKVSAMDALANSVRLSGSDFLTRILLVLTFAVLPRVLVQVLAQFLARKFQQLQQAGASQDKLQQWANWLRVYGFASYLFTLLLIFIGLYALSILYDLQTKTGEAEASPA